MEDPKSFSGRVNFVVEVLDLKVSWIVWIGVSKVEFSENLIFEQRNFVLGSVF